MRARWLKPEFFTDKKIAELGPIAALVFEALWVIADDGGTAKGDAETLKSQVFYRWSAVGVPEITGALRHLSEAGRIVRYSVGDDEFSTILNWKKHQQVHKPSKFRHPRITDGVRLDSAGVVPESGGNRAAPLPASPPPRHLDTYSSSSAPRVWTFEGEPLSTAAQPALAAILRRASDENACRTALASMLSGNDPATPQPTLPAFEQALIDFAANGERWNAAYFRTYLKRAAKPSPDIGAPQNGAARRATTGRAALLMGEIRELIQSHQPPGQAITRFIRRADVERLGTDVLAAYDAIGGAERVIGATGEQVSFLVRDFATALKAAEESNQRQTA